MSRLERLIVFVLLMTLVSTGSVAADGPASDPQPGFGFAIGVTAILIAIYLARRRQASISNTAPRTNSSDDRADSDGGI